MYLPILQSFMIQNKKKINTWLVYTPDTSQGILLYFIYYY